MNKCPLGVTPMLVTCVDLPGLITSIKSISPSNTPGKKSNSKCTLPSIKDPMMNLGDSLT